MILKILILGLLLTPIFSVVVCPDNYEFGWFGCYYFKDIVVPPDYKPTSLSCDNPNDKVLMDTPENYYNFTKPMYDKIFKRETELVNNFVVAYYNDSQGQTHLVYVCYQNPGFYRKSSVREYIKEHTMEVDALLVGLPLISVFLGAIAFSFILGRIIGAAITAWIFTILAFILGNTGYFTVPDFVYYVSTIISTILALAIVLTYKLQ